MLRNNISVAVLAVAVGLPEPAASQHSALSFSLTYPALPP